MIYLLAYITNDSTFLAVNEKGQYIGSRVMAETISMLPAYNWYTKDDPALIKAASQSEYSLKAAIVQVGSLQIAFRGMGQKHSRFIGSKKVHYASIVPGYEHLFMGVGIKAAI